MPIRIEARNGADERRVLIGMIVNDAVCGRVASRWNKDEGLFRSKWCNLVGGWAVEYYFHYHEAPQAAIEAQFERWIGKGKQDPETIDLVERFLQTLSTEYEGRNAEINSEYTIELAGRLFNRVHAERLVERLRGELDTGEAGDVGKIIADWNRVELGGGEGVNLFADDAVVDATFAEKVESLIKYPGDLGEFLGDALCRDALVALLGPEKRGKTWWLIDIAFRAVLQRRKVAFFEVGDMSQNQIIRRFGIRAAKQPRKAQEVAIPIEMKWVEGQEPTEEDGETEAGSRRRRKTVSTPSNMMEVGHDKKFIDAVTADAVKTAFKHLLERQAKSREELLRLSCHSNSSISADGVRAILQQWERGGWVPDVIVIDYADILAPPPGHAESRDAVNSTWKKLRSMSQDMHALVVTATQANAESYSADTIGRQHFSEDKRKFAHVTAMIGLNSTEGEKAKGLMRLNFIVLREDDFIVSNCVHVAGCLALGNPAMLSKS
jgi:hypothetical protein